MLTKLDDFPVHSSPTPLTTMATSDRNVYDRYWYNAHALDSSFYFGVGLCRYANLGIIDASLSLAIDGKQYAFHASGRAPTEATETHVGPLSLHILEPMGRHRLVIEDNDTDISCDLTFTPKTAALEEARQTLSDGRVTIMDATRLDQFGAWHGEIHYAGKTLVVDGATTFGLKDRSWGIRPVGDRYTGGAPLNNFTANHFMWLPIHWQHECSLAGLFEDGEGYQWHTDQGFLPVYPFQDEIPGTVDPAATMWQGIINYEVGLEPGTRRATGGTYVMNHRNGESMQIDLELTGLIHHMKGLGYQHPEWSHGKWHGELRIGSENWTTADLDPLALENIHFQQVVKATRTLPSGEREVGHGVLEQMHIGPHATLGFKEWFDGA